MISRSKYHLVLLVNLLFSVPGILLAQVEFSSSDLPIVVIETGGQEIPDDPRIIVEMGIVDNGVGFRNYITDPFNGYNGKISIELRGSTSQDFPKKQYALETQHDDGSNNNVSLMGMPAENDWILSAPYSDKTLMRNMLAYKLSEVLGHYAPRTRACELVLNGEYMGVYVLIEKIKRDKNRVDITELDSDETYGDELTGGYILKIDKSTDSSTFSWNTGRTGTMVELVYPRSDESITEQQEYIVNYIDTFEEALYGDNFSDSQGRYLEYLDLSSAMDYFLVNELAKNIDAYRLSTYLYKDRDSRGGKLCFGPVWDFNIAFANVDYSEGYNAEGLVIPGHPWWNRFLEDSVFTDALKSRWEQIRKKEFSLSKILGTIDSIADVMAEAQLRNFQRWDILSYEVWPNYFVGGSYQAELDYMKEWIIARVRWLDMHLDNTNVLHNPESVYETKIFPNPFSSFFTYEFKLKKAEHITLQLYDFSGKLVANIVSGSEFGPGIQQITWNYMDSGLILPDGFYAIVLKTGAAMVKTDVIIKSQ